jgi:hypothetical protein
MHQHQPDLQQVLRVSAAIRCNRRSDRGGGRAPKAMAYATVAGLPVAVGLYTALLPMVIYACWARPACSASAPPPPGHSRRSAAQRCRADGDPARLMVAGATLTDWWA